MKTAFSNRRIANRTFSLAFFMSASAITSGAAGVWGTPAICSAQEIAACGCELVEPSCEAPVCSVPCAENCDDSGCDDRGRSACSKRRFTLPGIGEGLLAGLDKMTDKFESGMGRLLHPSGRSKASCDSCGSSSICGCQTGVHENYDSSMMTDSQHSATSSSQESIASPSQPVVPPSDAEMNSSESTTESTAAESSPEKQIPVMTPATPESTRPHPMPQTDATGNPFIDEARTRLRNLPEIHVAKVQSSVRGSTRRRYAPQVQPSVIEALAPETRSLPEVVTAGALQQNRTPVNVYAR